MRGVSVFSSSKPTSFVVSHSFVIANVESGSEDDFKVLIDDHVVEEEVAVSLFGFADLQARGNLARHLPG